MPQMTPGSRHRAMREAAGLSRGQLAECSGVSLRTIARFELENRLPGVERLLALAQVLGCTTSDLLGETQDAA